MLYQPIELGWLLVRDGATLRRGFEISLAAREHHALTGEAIVEQWQVSRDLYVVLEGEVEVTADGTALATHGPGEFFGELAAIDWGVGSDAPARPQSPPRAPRACSFSTGRSSTG